MCASSGPSKVRHTVPSYMDKSPHILLDDVSILYGMLSRCDTMLLSPCGSSTVRYQQMIQVNDVLGYCFLNNSRC